MTLYYQDSAVTIYHGDCREVLPSIAGNVVVTDPPYGIGLTRKTSDFRGSRHFDAGASLEATTLYDDDPERIASLVGESIPAALARCDGRGVVFCGPAMLWRYPQPAAVGAVYLPNGAGRCSWGFQCFQPILFYGKDPWIAAGKGARPNSFKTEQPNTEKFDHPCPKPLRWMTWAVVRGSIAETDTILDPFMGSGTTLRAAKDLGRKAIGIEIEERYCEIAAKRMQQEVLAFG